MTLPEPTTLHHGLSLASPVPASGVFTWFAVLVPVLIALAWIMIIRQRQAHRSPSEHAFIALAKRMGLRTTQVRAVRRYAQEVAQVAPIAVLMNEGMRQTALGQA